MERMLIHRRSVLAAAAAAAPAALLASPATPFARAAGPDTGGSETSDPVVERILAGDSRITYLGAPVRSQIVGIPAAGIEDGRVVGYQVFKGIGDTEEPGTFVVFDAETGAMLRSFPLPGADGNQGAAVAADGRVYVATYHDYALHQYDPATASMRHVGPLNPDAPKQAYPWGMAPGPGNTVFIGTYPKGDLWQYDPDTDSYENWGHAAWGSDDPNQAQYAHYLAYNPTRKELFLSTGSADPAIWRIDTTTRDAVRITDDTAQPGLSSENFISALTTIGDRVLARGYKSKKLLVIGRDGTTEYWGNAGNSLSVQGHTFVPDPTDPERILFTNVRDLWTYDTGTASVAATGASIGSYLGAAAISPDTPSRLAGVSGSGTFAVDLTTPTEVDLHPYSFSQPTVLETVLTGPNGTMWAAGYMSGLTQVDVTGGGTEHPTLGVSRQFESSIIRDGLMYLGAYTGSSFQSYDPTRPTVAPVTLFTAQSVGFDRPITMTYDPVHDKAYMGSIPGYGLNQGGISVWDFGAASVKHYRSEVTPEQGVASAVFHPGTGMVYLGTNVDGGNGHPNSGLTEAFLVTWDPATDTKTGQLVPVADKRGVTGLTVGPDDRIWGVAEDLLFIYDPLTEKVVRTVKILGSGYGAGNHWAWGYLAYSQRDHMIYAALGSRLVRIDPTTFAVTFVGVGEGARLHADDAGNLYFLGYYGSQHLFRFTPDLADTHAPEVTATFTGANFGTVTLSATDDDTGVDRIEYRLGDSDWSVYTEPLAVKRSDRPVIRYRATDQAGNTSRIEVIALRPGAPQ